MKEDEEGYVTAAERITATVELWRKAKEKKRTSTTHIPYTESYVETVFRSGKTFFCDSEFRNRFNFSLLHNVYFFYLFIFIEI